MAIHKKLTSRQKALQINLEPSIYGSLAEIGAGQEVAGQFFRAGGAAGTVAKTMSAYDMTMSDAIYGGSSRYVSQDRLQQMLDKEFGLLQKRLAQDRGDQTRFFAFADTVAARGYKGGGNYHGWLGVRFQHEPGENPSQLHIHVKLLDNHNLFQQQALGDLGVNIVHSVFFSRQTVEQLSLSLMDNLTTDRILIDTISVDGPAFKHLDKRLLSLELVRNGYTDVIMFDADGEVVNASEALYKKNILCVRGGYRPPTRLSVDMFKQGKRQFLTQLAADQKDNVCVIAEISMNRLIERGENIDTEDFLNRVDLLAMLKQPVLITNFQNFHQVSNYLSHQTRLRVAFVARVHNIRDILAEENYANFDGGFLGSLGMMFGKNTQIYVYPERADDSEQLIGADSVDIPEHLLSLVKYFFGNGFIQDLVEVDPGIARLWSREIIDMRAAGNAQWKQHVPEVIVDQIESKNMVN